MEQNSKIILWTNMAWDKIFTYFLAPINLQNEGTGESFKRQLKLF